MKKRGILAVLLAFIVATAYMPLYVFADSAGDTGDVTVNDGPEIICTTYADTNIHHNSYNTYPDTDKTFLTKADGSGVAGAVYMKVTGYDIVPKYGVASDNKINVDYYDGDFNIVCHKTVKLAHSRFGTFYETADNYFIICGEINFKTDDTFNVLTVIRYDKKWNREASCDLRGAYTSIPFDAGKCRIAMQGNHMLIHTAHKMYDGHQSNFTIVVDTSGKMKVTDAHYAVSFDHIGYTSHSFNQFVLIDGDSVVLLDQGDAYPRQLYLQKFRQNITDGVLNNNSADDFYKTGEAVIFDIPGGIGDNDTGITVGSLEKSSKGYLIAGSAIYQHNKYENPYDYEDNVFDYPKDIFISLVTQDGKKVSKMNWLTDVATIGSDVRNNSASTPYLVKINDNKFMVLWGMYNIDDTYFEDYEFEGQQVYYTFVDASGTRTDQIYTLDGAISDCGPILDNGDVVWQTGNGADEYFYRIPVSKPSDPTVIHKHYEHDMVLQEDTIDAENYKAQYKCSKCGFTEEQYYDGPGTGTQTPLNVGFTSWWIYDNGRMDTSAVRVGVDKDDVLKLRTEWWTNNGIDPDTAGVEYEVYEWDRNSTEVREIPTDNCTVTTRNSIENSKRYTYADISFKTDGVYVIYVKGNQNKPDDYKEEFRIHVTKPLEGVTLTATPESPHVYGTDVTLQASEEGGRGYEEFTFTMIDSEGNETVLEADDSGSRRRTWKAAEPGTYTFRVSVVDEVPEEDPSAYLTAEDALVYVVEKKATPDEVPSSRYLLSEDVSTVSNDILGAAGWEFSSEDIGATIPLDEEMSYTVIYTGEDVDYCEMTEMEVSVKRTSCKHQNTVRSGDVAPTCCKEGMSGEVYCEDCGEIIEENRVLPVNPDNHEHVVTVPGKQADLFINDGYTASKVCDACGGTVEPAEVIPKINSYSISGSSAYYDGQPKTLDLTFSAGDYTLVEGKDYTVSYENNINPGYATATIYFIGNYNDKLVRRFEIKNRNGDSGGSGNTGESDQTAAQTASLEFTAKYGQTEARSMLKSINNLRTGRGAWYWNQDNKTKTQFTDLTELKYDYELEKVAMQRAAEIAVRYSHDRPDGSSCFTAFNGHGSYWAVGENIAFGFGSAEEVFTAWSETNENYAGQGHRRNMLSQDFNVIGIGYATVNGVPCWVQEFGKTDNPQTTETKANDSDTDVTVKVTRNVASVKSVSAQPAGTRIEVGESMDLPEIVVRITTDSPTSSTGTITGTVKSPVWTSSDPGIAAIEDGKIKGVSTGAVIISANVLGKKAAFRFGVGVDPPNDPIPEEPDNPGGSGGNGSWDGWDDYWDEYDYWEPAEIMDLPAVKIAKPKAAKKAVTVKWKKISKKNKKKIAGIEIQVATDKGFTNIVKTAKGKKTKTSVKVKKLKSKKKYYVRIRAYKNINGIKHVSKWSSVKKFKAK